MLEQIRRSRLAAGSWRVCRRGLGLAGLLLAGACSPARIVNAIAPKRLVAADVPYGPGPRHSLDVYAPDTPGPHPAVVFIYGGTWQTGDKSTYAFVGGTLASRGLVTIIPDYRLYPEVRYPDFLRDCAAAFAWARREAPRYGGATTPPALMAHSAGAYNAAMLTLDPTWLGEVGLAPAADISAMVGLAGPYDFLPLHDPALKAIFGDPTPPATQPINHVDGRNPPMLLLAGAGDTVVDPGNTTRLAARIRAAGGPVEDRIYADIGHLEIIGALSAPFRALAPVLRDSLTFLRIPAGQEDESA